MVIVNTLIALLIISIIQLSNLLIFKRDSSKKDSSMETMEPDWNSGQVIAPDIGNEIPRSDEN